MNTATSSSIVRRFRLAALTLAIALPALVNAATDTPEGAPQATSASVYADAIGSSRFERSGIRVEQGYTVESGNLYTRDGKTGSLVVVRSPDGAVTAIVDNPGKRGLLMVDAQGKSTFKEDLPYDYMTPDTVESAEVPSLAASKPPSSEPRYIDMLVGYSANALARLNADPVAYALAQLETANLGLRNSRVENLSLRLVGVNVFNLNESVEDITEMQLIMWKSKLKTYRDKYGADVIAAYAVGKSGIGGIATLGGDASLNSWRLPTAFRHEIGHNAGGAHCNDNPANYNFGYNNGKTSTILCGNSSPYYSTPAVSDDHGLPLGNAQTADMARVWRENAARLTGYRAELPGMRMILVSPTGTDPSVTARLSIPIGAGIDAGVVALDSATGPTQLVPYVQNSESRLNVKLLDGGGWREFDVTFLARRIRGSCRSEMNSGTECTGDANVELELSYLPGGDNASLPSGYYNGFLQLEARRPNSDWKLPINIGISVWK
ncbi:hypothetical protein J3P85_10845 [Pseudomonas sp. Z1-12]|uniref:hypothetical protein n=1 Tax=Pseudomonas sp. Z1-12 TaxID=2817408 RepID=UPI003DA8D4B6